MEEEDGDMEQGHLDHMKGVMLHIIRCSIEEKERELREDGIPNPRGAVPFGEVINLLYNSDMLQHETRAVLTVQKAFVCLLTLTNENSFYLQKDDKDEDFLIMYDPRNY